MTVQHQAPPPPSEEAAPAAPTPRASVAGATIWTLGGEAAAHGLRIASSLVLTRLLDPTAFGIMAIVQVFSQGLNMFSDLGIRPIIIRHERGDDPAFLNTIWTVRLARGAILALAFCALAWPASHFYDKDLLGLLMPVASLGLLLDGFLSTKFFSYERKLSRARPTMITVASSAAGIAFMIAGAVVFRSVWVLAWGGVFATLVRVVLSHVMLEGPPNRLRWDPAAWREVSHFGKWVFLNSLVTFFALQLDKLVFAKLIDLSMLGVYAIAVNIVQLPIQAVRAVGTSVAFPSFSRVRSQFADLAAMFDRMRLLILVGGGAGLSFLILNGPWLIELLYDPRYAEAGWILQIAAVGAWFIVLEAAHGFMLLALGQPRWLTAASVAKIVAWAVAVPVAFYAFGARGFQAALVAASAVEFIRYAAESARVAKAGLRSRTYERATTAVVLACGAAGFLLQQPPFRSVPAFLRALTAAGVYAAVWIPIGWWYVKRLKRRPA